jgi:hypothetical protein
MAPKFWMEFSRLTMTFFFDMASAPLERQTATIMGSSSAQTARATANRKDSSHGRWNSALTTRTNSTIRIASLRIRVEAAHANLERRRRRLTASRSLMSPSAVAFPVRLTCIVAVPETTEVPMNTAVSAAAGSFGTSAAGPACFSTGYDSPVSSD